jgi:hypothetical protein
MGEAETGVDKMRRDFDRLRGRLFELVEVTGMPSQQEEVFKKLIRRLTYDAQADLEQLMRAKI